MIFANHNKWYKFFFDWYFKFIIRKDFRNIIIKGNVEINNNFSLLVISNHFSWWDGFLIYVINNLIFKKKFHIMMLEEELAKRKFLTKIGTYSVSKKGKAIFESIHYTQKLLSESQNMVSIFPQGKIETLVPKKFDFESGVDRIITNTINNQIVLVAFFIDYHSYRKPTIYAYLKEAKNEMKNNLENIYNEFYQESYLSHSQLPNK